MRFETARKELPGVFIPFLFVQCADCGTIVGVLDERMSIKLNSEALAKRPRR
jgi:hypothetical protein